jgi:hypothetical protein
VAAIAAAKIDVDPKAGLYCCLCESSFCLVGSNPKRIVLEDDGETITIGFVCPCCVVERRDTIEAGDVAYASWLEGRR